MSRATPCRIIALPPPSASLLKRFAPRLACRLVAVPLVPNGEDFPQIIALGHVNEVGGGALNPFGKSFRAHKFVWSLEMCLDDADGDGETNGMELGDPCCVWKEGDRPARSWGLSHPGDPEKTSGMLEHPVDVAKLKAGVEKLRSFDDLAKLLMAQGLDCSVESAGKSGGAMTPETAAARDAEFWKFYFKGEADPPPPVTVGAALLDLVATLLYPLLHPVNFIGTVVSVVVETVIGFVDAARHGGLYKHGQKVFTLIVVGCLIRTLRTGVVGDFWRASRTEKVKIVLLATLWVEFISGLLHITFDNPAFQHTPFIGAMARDFQWHHKKPTHICNQTWPKFLGAIDSGVVVLFVIGTFIHPKSKWMRMFTIVSFPLFYLMMASHRWSHIRREQLPPIVQVLQQTGILLSQEVHSVHHVRASHPPTHRLAFPIPSIMLSTTYADARLCRMQANYDQNFSLMTGWSNPFLNWACINLMGPKNTTWAYFFFAWTSMPGWLPFAIDKARKQAEPSNQPLVGSKTAVS